MRLEGLPKTQPDKHPNHFARNRYRKLWHAKVGDAILATLAELTYKQRKQLTDSLPYARAHVILTRHSAVEPDPDGLSSSFKPILDGLVRGRVLENDKSANFVGGRPDYRWEYAPRNEGHISIFVDGSNFFK